ncbi:MAG: exodeoxyribonuclease V subunit gamma, partial [Actinomycetota bacterium]|nr:exodeoxyribonuclease V subunit gamma [Actinomycetota bacterium]
MPWHLHRSERCDALVAKLGDVLSQPTDDPFTPDVVAVPARGVERWLSQRLAHTLGTTGSGDGVSANIRFPPPAWLVDTAVTAAIGIDDDPWGRTTWRLIDVIDANMSQPWCAPLARHLAGGPGRRLATAQHLAGLFASYGQQRPAMLRDWQAGRDTDGAGA